MDFDNHITRLQAEAALNNELRAAEIRRLLGKAAKLGDDESVVHFISPNQNWDAGDAADAVQLCSFLVLTYRHRALDGEHNWWRVVHQGKYDTSIFREADFELALLHWVALRRGVDVNEARYTGRAALRVLTPGGE